MSEIKNTLNGKLQKKKINEPEVSNRNYSNETQRKMTGKKMIHELWGNSKG